MGWVTRFAPSPSGRLHLGHALSALFAAEQAGPGGCFRLRIEDIDTGRCREEFVAGIFEDLAWLGLSWPQPVRRQSEHLADYRAALDRLESLGLLYPCFCTRAEITQEVAEAVRAPHAPPPGPDGPRYPGTCRRLGPDQRAARLAAGTPHALRLDMEKALALVAEKTSGAPLVWHDLDRGPQIATPEIFGDPVLARKDIPTSYHLAVTLDDHLEGITLVTRGNDLEPATHLHRLLQCLLDLKVPQWRFHRLLTGPDGRRLAKRDHAQTLDHLRQTGTPPDHIRHLTGGH
ncbi:tRNA glutamyl-Q(34) synthetase GluQRS [Roseospirillum parvum]|uniref:Glutamyl-Q tRNA(Asp) synthetase n=1 Tax=Roseospirillum parvum TaxID=83401 RepID=A0A1G8D155_9PROT|nr:tRNA glutamyl-Q(34) synthetase GluQRS [Roseospirillum parvum]SDH51421.1 glutamyl-Q tRNA(Asp) synthetase [Roseospirillum parvum]